MANDMQKLLARINATLERQTKALEETKAQKAAVEAMIAQAQGQGKK